MQPLSYRWITSQGCRSLLPWHFCMADDNSSAERAFSIESNCGQRVEVFARRQDNDDCAGFIIDGGEVTHRVIYFHPSYGEQPNPGIVTSEHPDIHDFVAKVMLPDTQDWESEDEFEDLTQRDHTEG